MVPTVLVAAGLDPSGGAGLAADVAVAAARGVHAAAVVTALTVQDSARCHRWEPCPPSLIAEQVARLVDDLPIAAVKIGMVGTAEVARALAAALRPLAARGVPVVLDPVLAASVGGPLLDGADAAEALAPLLPLLALVTPNRAEAARLTGLSVDDAAGQLAAAEALRARGPGAALVKGGHLDGDEVVDLLLDGEGALRLGAPRLPGPTPHGTGCALSTEIACALALGEPLRRAVALARERLRARIAAARTVGKGRPFLGPP